MAAEGHELIAGDYIVHHLTFWQNHPPKAVADFSVFNYDSMFFSLTIGAIVCWLLWRAARKATPGVPGRFQAAAEILVEIVDAQARVIVHNAKSRTLVPPLALPRLLWLFGLHALDLLPVAPLRAVGGQ